MFLGMLGILATWLVLFVAFCGIGLTLQKSIGGRTLDVEKTLSSFWFGWSFVLLLLQVWHFFAPIDWNTLLFVLAIGIGGIFWCHKQISEFFGRRSFQL